MVRVVSEIHVRVRTCEPGVEVHAGAPCQRLTTGLLDHPQAAALAA